MTCDYDHTLCVSIQTFCCTPLWPVTTTTLCVPLCDLWLRLHTVCQYKDASMCSSVTCDLWLLCVSIQVLHCACSSVYHHILNRRFTVLSEWMMNATKVCLPRQNYVCLDKHVFVATAYFVATKDVFCRDKHVFVATKIILVADNITDNDSSQLHIGGRLHGALWLPTHLQCTPFFKLLTRTKQQLNGETWDAKYLSGFGWAVLLCCFGVQCLQDRWNSCFGFFF